MSMREHITVVGALHIGFGIIGLLIALIVFVAVVGGGLLSGDETAITVTAFVGTIVALIITVVSLPGIIGGIGLLRHQSWARFTILILSAISLVNVPIGTAVGIYSLWVLIQPESVALFQRSERREIVES